MLSKPTSRRAFLKGAAMTAATFTIVPRHVLGGPGYRAPSDVLNVAGIGVGGKGWTDVNGVATENIVALVDVDDVTAANAYQKFPNARRYKDYRVMLDQEKDLDAVTISTPDHTHAVIATAAMEAGKHVYVQKPLARTISETRSLMETARRTGVVTQMGNQGHANDGTRQIREIIEAGLIGPVREVHFWTDRPIWPQALDRPEASYQPPPTLDWDLWLGPAPYRPYHPAYYAPFNWRGWWDFGTGALGDIGCHAMDAAFWTLDLRNPTRIEAETTRRFPETAPAASRVTYYFPANDRHPDLIAIWYDGTLRPPSLPVIQPGEAPPWEVNGQMFVGDDGILMADWLGNNPRLFPESLHAAYLSNPPEHKYVRVPNDDPYQEWITAIKNGTQPGSNIPEHAGPLTEMVLLGNLAVRTGEIIEWDGAAGRVTNLPEANQYLQSTPREGWAL